jgi:hypothetical protein
MEQNLAIVDSSVELVEEQEIVEIPQNDLDRVAGGIISMFL